jgi:hypothetical protein
MHIWTAQGAIVMVETKAVVGQGVGLYHFPRGAIYQHNGIKVTLGKGQRSGRTPNMSETSGAHSSKTQKRTA